MKQKKIGSSPHNTLTYYTNPIRKKKPTLIFIHGLTSSAKMWQHSFDYFASNYNIILIDLRGHGNSTLAKHVFTQSARDIREIMAREKITSVHLVAQCIGPYIALEFLQRHPDLVASLTFTNGNYTTPLYNYFRVDIRALRLFAITVFKIGTSIAKRLDLRVEHARLTDYPRTPLWLIYLRNTLATNPSTLYEYYRELFNADYRRILSTIRIPVLIISATHDDVFPTRVSIDMHKQIKNSQLVLLEGDHSFTVKKHEEFHLILNRFLKRVY